MAITIFLCGDVMTGRGIDQILPHPVDPILYESSIRDAREYVWLADAKSGPIAIPVAFNSIWGDALEVLDSIQPAARVINLETSVTTSPDYWAGKGIHYRMNPANVRCLTGAGIDCCVLANNHVLDWGHAGLLETLQTLERAGIRTVGAGKDAWQAASPVAMEVGGGRRILVFAHATPTSGVPAEWAAGPRRPGVHFLPELSDESMRAIAAAVRHQARTGDVIIVSIHWGGNWGSTIPREQVDFAHGLIDQAGVSIVHGHSCHHVKGLEIYKNRLILYGCGDFLDDYEGIGGYERYRPDLALMYFPTVDEITGALVDLRLAPMRIRHFRVNHSSWEDSEWLRDRLQRTSIGRGVKVGRRDDGLLSVHWDGSREK